MTAPSDDVNKTEKIGDVEYPFKERDCSEPTIAALAVRYADALIAALKGAKL